MATDSGTWTSSTLPTQYQDPKLSMTATATNAGSGTSITYTTASNHNLVVGQSVIAYGYANAWLNYAPNSTINGVSTKLGAGVPAVVASVTSSTVFTVNTGVLTTASSAVAGYIQNDSLVTNQPLDNTNTWLNPTSVKNQAVGLEWGDSFSIQPNTDRTVAAGATDRTTASIKATAASDVVANGSTITYTTLANHGLVAGSRITIDGLLPAQFNYNDVVVSSVPTSTTFTIATTTTGTYDYANSFGLVGLINSTGGNAQAVATSAVGAIQVSNVTATSGASLITYTSTAHSLITGQYVTIAGMVPNGLNVSGNITKVDADNFTIASTANPGTSTKSGFASVVSNSYTTQQPHGLIAGQDTVITGASLAEYNVQGRVVSTASTTIANVNVAKLPGGSSSATPVTVSGTAVTYVLASGHSVTTSDSASVYGFVGGANLNTVGSVAVSAVATNSVTINTVADVTSLATSAIAVSGTPGVVTYTSAAHGFKPGQIVTVSGYGGADAGIYNASSVIISATANTFVVSAGAATAKGTVTGTGTLSVAATTAAKAIAGVTAVAAYDTTSITLTMPNNFVVGQSVTVAGTGASTYNTTGTVLSADPSQVKIGYASNVALSGTPAVTAGANAITVASVALPVSGSAGADASKIGFLVKKGATFVSPAYVGNADASWGYTGLVPSVQVNPNQDNHDIIKNSRLGYPDYFPKYVVPNVVGKTYTNAIQALQSAGLTGILSSTAAPALTVSAATVSGSVVTYTVNSVTTLNVGDVVTITSVVDSVNSGGTVNTQFNRNLVQIGTIDTANNKFTVNMTGVTGTYSSGGSVQPYNTVVTAQSVAAGTSLTAGTDALSVTLTRFPGL